jgi:hypothetical protein
MGCITAGEIRETRSAHDGVTVVEMNPVNIASIQDEMTSKIKIGLVRSSMMKPSEIYMKVFIARDNDENMILDQDSLSLDIDDLKIALLPVDIVRRKDKISASSTSRNTQFSSIFRIYAISQDILEKLLNGKKVAIKVVLKNGVIEGDFSGRSGEFAKQHVQKYYDYLYVPGARKIEEKTFPETDNIFNGM